MHDRINAFYVPKLPQVASAQWDYVVVIASNVVGRVGTA